MANQQLLKQLKSYWQCVLHTCNSHQMILFMIHLCNYNKNERFIKPPKGISSSRPSKYKVFFPAAGVPILVILKKSNHFDKVLALSIHLLINFMGLLITIEDGEAVQDHHVMVLCIVHWMKICMKTVLNHQMNHGQC